MFYSLSLTEPNAPPANVRGQNTSSTTILVEWGVVPAADQNGIILSYTVGYTALPGGSEQTKVVNAPATDTTLTGLNKFTNYSITVFASTSKGGGNVSEPTVVITDEDSKLLYTSCNFAVSIDFTRVPRDFLLYDFVESRSRKRWDRGQGVRREMPSSLASSPIGFCFYLGTAFAPQFLLLIEPQKNKRKTHRKDRQLRRLLGL